MLVHTNSASELVRGWANLTRFRGTISGRTGGGFVVEPSTNSGGPTKPFELRMSQFTTLLDAYTGTQAQRGLTAGSEIDAIGLAVDGGIAATLVSSVYPGQRPAKQPQMDPKDTVTVLPNAFCTYTYYGMVSWYNCSNGGRCGCGGSNASSALAWPAIDTCSCCNFSSCCNCGAGCTHQVYIGCGHQVHVRDRCNGKHHNLYVRDCGPCMNHHCNNCNDVCNHSCTLCGGTSHTPKADLTRAAFSRFRNPANHGCFRSKIKVTIQQAEC